MRRILSLIPYIIFAAAVAITARSGAESYQPVRPSGADVIIIDTFTTITPPETVDPVPEGWNGLKFPKIKKYTRYSVESADENLHLKARSSSAASAVYRKADFDLREYPVLTWSWKIEGTLKKGDALTKAGDDFPARVYVTFEYDPSRVSFLERIKYGLIELIYKIKPPGNAVVYIWANRLEKGAHVPNPYTDKAGMFAVESGSGLAGRWVTEERNVFEDYKTYFGEEPATRVTGVAVMTDTDNTGEEATAYYDNIIFKKFPLP